MSARIRRPSWGWYSLKSWTGRSRSSVRRYSGTRLNAARSDGIRRLSRSDASSGVKNHLWGLTTIESARSQPDEEPAALRGRALPRRRTPRRRAARALRAPRSPRSPARGPRRSTRWCRSSPRRRWAAPGGPVRRERRLQRVGPHRVHVVGRDPATGAPAQAQRHACLLDAAVRLLRRVDDGRADLRPTSQPEGGRVQAGSLARGRDRDERRRRCRVGQEPIERVGQAERATEPADDHLLELRADRRGPPQHRVLAQHGGDELAEDPRARRRGREVGQEAGVLPVRRVRLHQIAPRRRGSRRSAPGRPAGPMAAGHGARPARSAAGSRSPRRAPGSPRAGRPSRGRRPGTAPGSCRRGHRAGRGPGVERRGKARVVDRRGHAWRRSGIRSSSVRRAAGRRSPNRA